MSKKNRYLDFGPNVIMKIGKIDLGGDGSHLPFELGLWFW